MEEKIRLAVFGQKRLSREGGIEIVVKELCTRMAQNGCDVTCYNRAGHHVSGAEYDKTIEYDGIRQKVVPTIEKKGLAAVSSSFFAALYSAFGRYDVVHAALSELKFLFVLASLLVVWYLAMSKRKGRGMILALFFVIALYVGMQIFYYVFPFWANYLSFDNIMTMISDQEVYANQMDVGRTAVFSKLTPVITKWAGQHAVWFGIGLGNGDYSDAIPMLNSAFYL